MTTIENAIILIAKTLEEDYGFKIPGAFIPGGDSRDIHAFIDIEELFLINFKFMNDELNKIGINDLYKISKDDFINEDMSVHFPPGNTEEKDIGMGFAKSSSDGKGPNTEEAEEIKNLMINAGTTKNLHLYPKAKASKLLFGIGDDKLTDFFVKIKHEDLILVTEKLIEIVITKLGMAFTKDEIISKMKEIYYNRENKIGYPFMAPLEIIEIGWLVLGENFTNKIFEAFLKEEKIALSDEYYKINGSSKRNKYILEKHSSIVKSEKAKIYFNKMITKEIEIINEKIEKINNINDLKNLDESWRLSYALKNYDLVKKLNLTLNKVLIIVNDDHYEPFTYLVNQNDEFILILNSINSYEELKNELEKVKEILKSRNKVYSKYKIFINKNNISVPKGFEDYIVFSNNEFWS